MNKTNTNIIIQNMQMRSEPPPLSTKEINQEKKMTKYNTVCVCKYSKVAKIRDYQNKYLQNDHIPVTIIMFLFQLFHHENT
jgi:hypothetical protein